MTPNCLSNLGARFRFRKLIPSQYAVHYPLHILQEEPRGSARRDPRPLIGRRGRTLPVAYDHDGGVANAYAVAICPTGTFAYEGGRVEGTSLTLIEGAALRARLANLMRGPTG